MFYVLLLLKLTLIPCFLGFALGKTVRHKVGTGLLWLLITPLLAYLFISEVPEMPPAIGQGHTGHQLYELELGVLAFCLGAVAGQVALRLSKRT